MKGFFKSLLGFMAAATTVIGFYAALPSIGINLPRPAWDFEVAAVHKQVVGTRITVYDAMYFSTLNSLSQNLAIQNDLKAKGSVVPTYLVADEQSLRAKLNEQAMALSSYRTEYAKLDQE